MPCLLKCNVHWPECYAMFTVVVCSDQRTDAYRAWVSSIVKQIDSSYHYQSNVGTVSTEPLIHEVTIYNHLLAQITDFIMSYPQKVALDKDARNTRLVSVSHYAREEILTRVYECMLTRFNDAVTTQEIYFRQQYPFRQWRVNELRSRQCACQLSKSSPELRLVAFRYHRILNSLSGFDPTPLMYGFDDYMRVSISCHLGQFPQLEGFNGHDARCQQSNRLQGDLGEIRPVIVALSTSKDVYTS